VTVVADLGHTSIKTAIAERGGAALTGMALLESCAAPSGRPPAEVHEAVAAALGRAVQRAAAATARPGPVHVIASVASYVHAGVPLDDGRGSYGTLAGQLAWLRGRIEAAAGTNATVTFIHDGTAAAATAGALNSATITAGTWLGGGFRPAHTPPLLDLAPNLRIS
jgi:sugar (pentulose or hexulose) kinase